VNSVNISFDEFQLANGLHVILHVDHFLPIVAINLWYHVGSKNENENRTGFAHMFEHMMFQGSGNVPPNGHFRYVQEAGGTLNGSTSFDRTNYFETVPSHQFELGLWLEADRMRSLSLSQQTLDTQRSVVMEERRSRYDNQPYGTMYEQLFSHAFKLQPYSWPTIGSMEDIRNATLADVKEFHSMYYRPDNASLCIAGDIDPVEARSLIERHFGDIGARNGEIFRPFVHEPAQQMQVRDYVYDAIPLPAIIAGFHIPDLNDRDFVPLEILANILSSGKSSRLHHKLVYEQRVAQSVLSFAYGMELPGLYIVRAIVQQGKNPESVEALIWEELRDIRENGVSQEELQKAKNGLEAAYIRNLSSLQSRADLLNACFILSKDTNRINTELESIHEVQLADIHRVASRWLVETNATVLHYRPYPKDPVS